MIKETRLAFNTPNTKAASLALLIFTYLVLALSVSSIQYYETFHRVTMLKIFEESLFGSTLADSLAAIGFLLLFLGLGLRSSIWTPVLIAIFAVAAAALISNVNQLVIAGLLTGPIITAVVIAAKIANRRKVRATLFSTKFRVDGIRVATVFLVIIIIIEIGALARWITYPVFPTEIYSDASWSFAKLESSLFHSFGLMSPVLLALIGFCFLYRWYIFRILRKVYRIIRRGDNPHAATEVKQSQSIERKTTAREDYDRDLYIKGKESPLILKRVPINTTERGKVLPIAILSGALVIAPLLMIYPHLPTVNPSGQGVSTDEQYYLNWTSRLRSTAGPPGFADAFTITKGDRPLTLLLITGIANLLTVPDLMVIRYLPVALAPALVAASYLLVRHSLGSKKEKSVPMLAALVALFTAFSPQVVVGEYAGLLANWLALVAGFPALVFLIKTWDSDNTRRLATYSACLFGTLVLVMLFHIYIWFQLLIVVLIFCILSYIFSKGSNPNVKVLAIVLVIASCFAVDYAKSLIFDSPQLAGSDSLFAINIQSSQEYESRWDQLRFTLGIYVGGFLSSPVLFLPALVWVAAKANLARGLDRVLVAMLFLLALPILFGTVEFQTRVLHNTPMQIPALLALYPLVSQGKYRFLSILLIIAIIAVTATFALRAMANLYFEAPEGYVLDQQFLLP